MFKTERHARQPFGKQMDLEITLIIIFPLSN